MKKSLRIDLFDFFKTYILLKKMLTNKKNYVIIKEKSRKRDFRDVHSSDLRKHRRTKRNQ